MRTFGVEEELLLVDSATGAPLPVAREVLEQHGTDGILTKEFQLEQIEIVARPHSSIAEFAEDIRACRARADAAARAAGARVAALGTFPMRTLPHPTPHPRYEAMVEQFGITSREQLTCGCHIHVSVESPDEGAAVLDRIRIWLPVITALSANSPFWQGEDSGYASFRSQVWQRLPGTGPNGIFGSAEAYRRLVQELLATGVPVDEGMLYFDARLSRNHPTAEIRVPDVCLDVDDTVLLAALVRALVETAARHWRDGRPPEEVPLPVLRHAGWQASRWGIEASLLDPVEGCPREATEVVMALLEHLRPVLAESGDEAVVESRIGNVLRNGTGARHQRRVLENTGRMADVVLDGIAVTMAH
ncbi:glutamate--cysteine ligase [Arthrobacter sp. H14]|uniref:glutamate--cysteine ligase n=1 Tax=Arthrobacter sp. H14 TaxID=1312959 RepID=UPI0004AE20A7|nr:glutamate--cysteine ligase [Arthrobacter sp. H14]